MAYDPQSAHGCWLTDNLALQGRHHEARALVERRLAVRNDVRLLAEEYEPCTRGSKTEGKARSSNAQNRGRPNAVQPHTCRGFGAMVSYAVFAEVTFNQRVQGSSP